MLVVEATPKTIMRVMGVKGLTLYHLKSHLQVRPAVCVLLHPLIRVRSNSCWHDALSHTCMLANLFGLFMCRNSGWESSRTRTSTIMQLRMVRADSCNSIVKIKLCI